MSITASEVYFEVDEDLADYKKIDPQVGKDKFLLFTCQSSTKFITQDITVIAWWKMSLGISSAQLNFYVNMCCMEKLISGRDLGQR